VAGTLLGIDLGTTYCAVATLDATAQPVMVPNRDGDILTPSAVLLVDEHTVVVGQPALLEASAQPDRVAMLIKRQMGQAQFKPPRAGQTFRPEVLSALLLRKLYLDAQLRFPQVGPVVITVPAYFDDSRRQATLDAGRIAGLDVLDLLDEPGAAALAYGLRPGATSTPQNVLVYDLGGGTFDVTVVRLAAPRFQTLAIEGDVQLGGRDWDATIVDWLAEQFPPGNDPRSDEASQAALFATAERAKRSLSSLPQTRVSATHAGQQVNATLTRAEFEQRAKFLWLRTQATTETVVRRAGLTWAQIDRVVLVGGSTHMPATVDLLRRLSGQEPERSLVVSEVVARGAALHAHIVAQQRPNPPAFAADLAAVVEIQVNAHSLGIEVRKGNERINDIMLPKNTQLPASATRTYRTASANQTRVRVQVLQGEATQAAACLPVGECWIEPLPPGVPAGAPIQVRCGCASNGLVTVEATDLTSGKRAQATLHRASGMSDAEIRHAAAWVRQLQVL
jgi:molecular chaperone DnaK